MSKEKFEMIAKTFQGLEEVLAKELINLGADDVEILRRGVSFKGDLKMLYKANLCCRTALRILKPIFKFQAEDADDVYNKVKQLDWSLYLDPSKTFAVDAVVYSEIFKHSKFLSYKVKDAARALEEGLPYITQTVEKLHEKGILTDEEFQEVRFEDIDAFFRTETGERAAKAPKLKREQEFLLQKEINGVPAVVQGVIDCWFEDEKGLVLIDYKNSWAADDQAEDEIVDRYTGQVRLYREALELATGKPVSESWLYLFRSRRFVPVFLNK